MKRNEIKKVDSGNQELTQYDFVICPNCRTREVGKFCPNCGQSNKDFNKPIKEIFSDLLDSINLDIRIINTLLPFLTKPGFLTQEYFRGKRKRYVPPMRMYILFSVLFFFLAQFTDLSDFKNIGNVDMNEVGDSVKQEVSAALTEADVQNLFSSENINEQNKKDSTENSKKENVLDGLKIVNKENSDSSTVVAFSGLSPESKDKLIESLESDTTIPESVKRGFIGGLNASDKVDLFWGKFLNNISYVLFLLMPFFALLLSMTLWKSKKLYVHHLIFSINYHSFIFALASFLIVLGKMLPDYIVGQTKYLLWLLPLYLMFGIKRFYERSYVQSFFKTVGLFLTYTVVICIVVALIIVFTVQGFYEV